ncbi:uncharacterized protein LOC110355336 [Columba livia]|uniref:uncharacterized protein LOC110355336 n=1 Tax=Columba livia TaxID=8932 RepID=UPI0031BBAC8F
MQRVFCPQVCTLTTKHSWNPKEWDGNIWSESSDSNIESEFDPDVNGREIVGAQPPIEMMLQQERADGGGGGQIAHTHSLKELTAFSEISQQTSEAGIPAQILPAWDSGAVSIHLLADEKDFLSPIAYDDQIQQCYAQLQTVRGLDRQDIIARTLYQRLCAAVLTAYAEPVESVLSCGNWCTMEESIDLVWQIWVTYALIMGSDSDRVAVTNATGNAGTLANALRGIGAVISGPSVWVLDNGNLEKLKRVIAQVMRTLRWNDLVQASIPWLEIRGIIPSEIFCRLQKLMLMQKSQPALAPPPTLHPPSTPPATSVQDQFAFTWQQKQYTCRVLSQRYKHNPSVCHEMIVADIALWLDTVTDCHDIDNLLIMAVSQQETEAAAEFLKVHLQDRGWAINLMKTQGPCATVLFLEIFWLW